MDRSSLRRSYLALREERAASARAEDHAQIAERLLPYLPVAGTVALYAGVRGEADPGAALVAARPEIRWVWPVVAPRERTMRFRHPRSALVPRPPFGIPEPVDGPFVEPEAIHVVLVPGVVFDQGGYRLGYGGGYYDRFLASLPAGTLTVGVAWSWQIVAQLPREPHDKPVAALVTPKRYQRI